MARRIKIIASLAAILPVFLAISLYTWFQYENTQMKQGLDNINVPEGWELVNEDFSGNRICTNACPSFHKRYRADFSDGENLTNQFKTILQKAGAENIKTSDECVVDKNEDGPISICSVVGQKDNGMKLYIGLYVNPETGYGAMTVISHNTYLWGFFDDS